MAVHERGRFGRGARSLNNRFKNQGELVYGADSGANQNHFIRFTAMIHSKANIALSSVAESLATSNLQVNRVVTRAPMVSSETMIKLFLPAQIAVSQKVNYGEAEIGGLIAGGMSALKSFMGTDGSLGDKGVASLKAGLAEFTGATGAGGIGDVALRAAAKVGEGLGVTGGTAAINITSGVTVNNRTEMMFEGLDRRAFAFTFRLIPHSAEEAATIKQIVDSFRYYMLPEVPEGATFGRALKAPSTFKIQYAHEKELHKIGESVLEGVDVKYGGDRPQFHRDNRPTETELTLQFKELDIMTKRSIVEGF